MVLLRTVNVLPLLYLSYTFYLRHWMVSEDSFDTNHILGQHCFPMFIHYFGSNGDVFYLYTVTSAACSSTPCNAHAWLYKGCGYCQGFSVTCNIFVSLRQNILVFGHLTTDYIFPGGLKMVFFCAFLVIMSLYSTSKMVCNNKGKPSLPFDCLGKVNKSFSLQIVVLNLTPRRAVLHRIDFWCRSPQKAFMLQPSVCMQQVAKR